MVGETMGHDLKPQVDLLLTEHMVKNRIKTFYAIIKIKDRRDDLHHIWVQILYWNPVGKMYVV